MSFFEFPHTRTYDTDLGWIIKQLGELLQDTAALQAWAAEHKEEYAELAEKVEGLINNLVDVIEPWDSSIAYHIFSIVSWEGQNYIAVQDVPVGAMITNTDYWQPANTVVEQINAIGLTVSDIDDKVNDMEPHVSIQKDIGLAFPYLNMNYNPAGMCCILYTGEHATLIDLGRYDVFSDVKTQLDRLGITTIDNVFITHFHFDHAGANEGLSAGNRYDHWKTAFDMTNTVFYLPPDKNDYTAADFIASFPNNTINRLENGIPYTWNDVVFTAYNISPADYSYYDSLSSYDYNNYSAIIYANYGNSSFLCTGDIGVDAQRRCYEQGYTKHADIMTAPHHAMNVQSDPDFVMSVNPMFVYIPDGKESQMQGLREAAIGIASEFATIFSNHKNDGIVSFTLGLSTISASGAPIVVSQYSIESRNKIYVNENYTGVNDDGTRDRPYRSIRRAVSACKNCSVIELLSDITQSMVITAANGFIEINGNNHTISGAVTPRDGANVYFHDVIMSGALYCYNSRLYYVDCTFMAQLRMEQCSARLYGCRWMGTGFTNCLYVQYSDAYLHYPKVDAGTEATRLVYGDESILIGGIAFGDLNGVRAINIKDGVVQMGRLVDSANALNTVNTNDTRKPPFLFDLTNNRLIITANDGITRYITADPVE